MAEEWELTIAACYEWYILLPPDCEQQVYETLGFLESFASRWLELDSFFIRHSSITLGEPTLSQSLFPLHRLHRRQATTRSPLLGTQPPSQAAARVRFTFGVSTVGLV